MQDVELIRLGVLQFDDLVTVRRGEMVLPPMATIPVPAQTEWIKIQGVGGEWCCRFLDPVSNTCTIYENRPASCRALKCWDTTEILAMAGRGLLCRTDLIESDDPLLPLVQLQEEQAPVPDLEKIVDVIESDVGRDQVLHELNSLVQKDMMVRTQAVRDYNISVARELFYFGRPLFQVLHPLGLVIKETSKGIVLQFSQ